LENTGLEEDEVDDLRDVDAGVEHVDGDGDRRLFGRSESVEEGLGLGVLADDDAGELAGVRG
jgi:hypothetical protein